MPLYECHCLSCDLTFEVLAPVSKAKQARPCPDCGRLSERIVSAFAIASGSSAVKQQTQEAKPATAKKNQSPLCLQYPHLPLLCHMDDKAARRWIAHSKGRGSEFDDKMAKREELQKQRGIVPPKAAADSHGHSHEFRRHGKMKEDAAKVEHGHGHPHANGGSGGGSAKPDGHSHGHGKSHSHEKSHGHSHQTGHAHDH